MTRLPDHLPILDRRLRAPLGEAYAERELTAPVDLCDARGRLNPAAIGFSRRPLVRANLSGHWPRKKRWNFWSWIGPDCVFSVTLADIDFTSFCSFTLTDFRDGAHWSGASYGRPGRFALSEHVEASVSCRCGGLDYANRIDGADLAVCFRGRARDGGEVVADLAVRHPPGQESLNVVVPWTPTRFQCNSKHAALPCEGELRAGARRYRLEPRTCFGIQDWGRGVWPYRSFWNWGVATGRAGDGLLGVNFGARWTTGTGSNENGILWNGRLHKLMEDLRWEYDAANWRKPWRVVAPHSGALDLVLEPVAAHTPRLNLGVLATGGVCAFGRWRGRVRCRIASSQWTGCSAGPRSSRTAGEPRAPLTPANAQGKPEWCGEQQRHARLGDVHEALAASGREALHLDALLPGSWPCSASDARRATSVDRLEHVAQVPVGRRGLEHAECLALEALGLGE